MKVFTEKNIVIGATITMIICFIVLCFLSYYDYWKQNIDAVTENPILIHTQGVDVMNLHIVGATHDKDGKLVEMAYYKIGSLVQFENSYCKLRRAKGRSEWWLINDATSQKFWYDIGEYMELPLGCTPPTQDKLATSNAKIIPMNVPLGTYHFEAVVTRLLPDGRERKEDLKTESFVIIK